MTFAAWSLIVYCQLSLLASNRPPASVPTWEATPALVTCPLKLKYLNRWYCDWESKPKGVSPAKTWILQSPLVPPPPAAGFHEVLVANKPVLESVVADAPI